MSKGLGFLLVFAAVWVICLLSTFTVFATFLPIPVEARFGLAFGIPSTITGCLMLREWWASEQGSDR